VSAGGPGIRVALAGWYGAANLGDELILSTFAAWVREAGGVPTAISVHPAFTSALLGIESASYTSLVEVVEAIARSDLLVLGGGGLFQEYDVFDRPSLRRFPARNVSQFAQFFYLARELGVPAAALAQGVGPLRRPDARGITADVFERAVSCSVRDVESARLLRSIGVKRLVPIAPDPAWCFPMPPPAGDLRERYPQLAGKRVLAMAIRDWPFDAHWEEAFVAAFRAALPAGWGCLWLDFARTPSSDPSTVSGSEIAHRIVPRLPDIAHAVWTGMQLNEAAALIGACDAMLAMRLHGVLLGHLAALPVVAIEYDDKVRALGDELRVPRAQRMPLHDIGARLGNALAMACGHANEAPFRLAPDKSQELARSALAHRDLLWRAMAERRKCLPDTPVLLTEWLGHESHATRQVVEGVLHRLRSRKMADRR
jgi:polysaccharide pyruvyl transferase CsaB